MRRAPTTERPEDDFEASSSVRRISTLPNEGRAGTRGSLRASAGRRATRAGLQRGPSARAWLLRAVLGLATLAALWLLLQWFFPTTEERPAATRTVQETAVPALVGAPEPPASTAPAQVPPTLVAQPTLDTGGDRLPGLSSAAPKPGGAEARAGAPSTSAPSPTAAPAGAQPEQDVGRQQAATAAPIPTPQPAPGTAVAAAPTPRPQPTPAPPPPAPAGTNGPLQLRASASPAHPVSADAVVTISLNLTSNGSPVAGAFCMSTVYFRTATVRQPMGGVTTGPGGVASFTIDAKGATFDRYVPVDVTCNTRQGSVTARTGFTPVRGR